MEQPILTKEQFKSSFIFGMKLGCVLGLLVIIGSFGYLFFAIRFFGQ